MKLVWSVSQNKQDYSGRIPIPDGLLDQMGLVITNKSMISHSKQKKQFKYVYSFQKGIYNHQKTAIFNNVCIF